MTVPEAKGRGLGQQLSSLSVTRQDPGVQMAGPPAASDSTGQAAGAAARPQGPGGAGPAGPETEIERPRLGPQPPSW